MEQVKSNTLIKINTNFHLPYSGAIENFILQNKGRDSGKSDG
jgi:hypothetical protein